MPVLPLTRNLYQNPLVRNCPLLDATVFVFLDNRAAAGLTAKPLTRFERSNFRGQVSQVVGLPAILHSASISTSSGGS